MVMSFANSAFHSGDTVQKGSSAKCRTGIHILRRCLYIIVLQQCWHAHYILSCQWHPFIHSFIHNFLPTTVDGTPLAEKQQN